VVVLGRLFFVLIFLMSGPLHFSKQEVAYAAAQGVPWPSILVPFSGVLAFAGGPQHLAGLPRKTWRLATCDLPHPVTIMMHNFWAVHDPMMAQVHMAMFMKISPCSAPPS